MVQYQQHKLYIKINEKNARCMVKNLINRRVFTHQKHVDLELNVEQIEYVQLLYNNMTDPRKKIALKVFMVQYSRFHQVFKLDVAIKRRRETDCDQRNARDMKDIKDAKMRDAFQQLERNGQKGKKENATHQSITLCQAQWIHCG